MKRFLSIVLMAFCVSVASVFSQEWGLVLSGGGGKGAYQVGVWKALCQYGLDKKITAISGTSVGGLNAALFACVSADECQKIWMEKVPSHLRKNDQLISQEGLLELISSIKVGKIRNALPDIYVTTISSFLPSGPIIPFKPLSRANRICLNSIKSDSEITKTLLATSAFPVLTSPIQLEDGFYHVDGGGENFGGDNVPLDSITGSHPRVKNIFVVYLSSKPDRRVRKIDYKGINIVEIIPSIDLGNLFEGTVNFDSSRIQLLIETGYDDCCRILSKMGMEPVSQWWFQ